MRTRPTQVARWLAYCEAQLAGDDLTEHRRQILEQKADVYRRALKGRCRRCGRTLTDPASVEQGIGPECIKTAVTA